MVKNNFWLYATLATLSLSVGVQSSSMKPFADANTQESVATSKTTSDTSIQKGIWGNTPWTFNPTDHIFTLGNASKSETYITGHDATTSGNSEPSILNDQEEPFTIQIVGTVRLPSDCQGLFQDMDLKAITYGDNGRLDTSDVTNMNNMFESTPLQKLDASNWNTSKLQEMSNMFMDCESLESVNLSNWDNDKLTTMTGAFGGDSNLKTINFENFKTPALKYMGSAFESDGVTSLDLSSFNFSKLDPDDDPEQGIFGSCSALSVLKLSPSFFGTGSTDWYISDHENGQKIPGSDKTATGPGWREVDELHGGTIENPQGTFYKNSQTLNDGIVGAKVRPSSPVTFVWEQKTTKVSPTKVTVEDVDSKTQQPIPNTKLQTVNGYSKQSYDVSGAQYHPAITGYTWDKKTPTNAKGKYGTSPITVKYTYVKNSESGTSVTTPNSSSELATSASPSGTSSSSSVANSGSGSSPAASTSSSAASSSSNSNSSATLPDYAVTKGTVVYGINKLGLYKSTKFSKANRKAWYAKKSRINRPMFVVTGYRRSSDGVLRYRVRDVNHHSKTGGMTGYITASQKYVRPVYYATKHATITVINPRGVNAYRKADLTKKVTNYRQGTVLHIKRLVHHNLTTRYVLSNGHYITANRKLVEMGRHKQVKSVKTKRSINRYRNVDLTKKSRRIAKNRTLKVYGYDYSHGHELTKHGTLRYRVAGGYITANTKYVRAYK